MVHAVDGGHLNTCSEFWQEENCAKAADNQA